MYVFFSFVNIVADIATVVLAFVVGVVLCGWYLKIRKEAQHAAGRYRPLT